MQNKSHIDSFFKKIDTLSEDQIRDALTFFGPEILNHPEAITKKDLIASHLPFAYHWVKQILSSDNLKEAFFDIVTEDEAEVQDFDLAELLLSHDLLKKYTLSDRMFNFILFTPYKSNIKELWLEYFTLEEY